MKKDVVDLLKDINSPADLRKLPLDALPEVCNQIRQYIIQQLSCNPGHFASSLGVVELTVALHYVYDTPYDRIVWDVGHQAGGHKILTGRKDRFSTYRRLHGLMPFPSPEESEYDTFTSGHASTSISAALGMAVAANLHNEDRKVVAVIGDGSMSGGLAYEGLNNASTMPNNLLIILNDNNMSIDRSVGGMTDYLHQLHTSSWYNSLRYSMSQKLLKLGWLNEERKRKILRFNNSLKSLLTNQKNVFEGMDIRYFGPLDGHDVISLVHTLQSIKGMTGPKMLHIHTIKGKGFPAAEKNATIWHAPGKFNPETGERLECTNEDEPLRYQDVFGETLLELAESNPNIVGVTPAMPTGCSMNIMMKKYPERTFDVGIAEGHAVTFSAGMAKDGLIPFCNIYSAFAQRSFDNIIHDVAIGKLNVVLCFDRAGLVGEDGATHHGAFDMTSLRAVPNMIISSPMDEHELRNLMFTAQQPNMGPFVIRYPRGKGVLKDWRCPMQALPVGKGRLLQTGDDIAVLSIGPLGNDVEQAISIAKEKGIGVQHYDMRFLKPIDEDILRYVGEHYSNVITVEDGALKGGLASAVMEFMSENGYPTRVHGMGLPDEFIEHGKPAELYQIVGLDVNSIAAKIEAFLGK